MPAAAVSVVMVKQRPHVVRPTRFPRSALICPVHLRFFRHSHPVIFFLCQREGDRALVVRFASATSMVTANGRKSASKIEIAERKAARTTRYQNDECTASRLLKKSRVVAR
jgi:hypothetical protein